MTVPAAASVRPLREIRSLSEVEAEITRWLVRVGLEAADEAEVLDGLCARLVAGGSAAVARGHRRRAAAPAARRARLPLAAWPGHRQGGLFARRQRLPRRRGVAEEPVLRPGPRARRRRAQAPAGRVYRRGEFPLLDRFQAEGSTDYLALAVSYSGRLQFGELQGLLCSFQTDRPGGFDDAEIELLRRLATVLALAIKSIIAVETAGTLMATYLGEDAGRRVMAGAINRGVAETVRAVLWYSDLEGFTRIADHEPAPELIGLLNDYAEAVVGSVHAHGGQVLKFIGDGILAMFPLADGVMPCGRALDAAAGAIAAAHRLSAERVAAGRPATGMHVALHVGDVLYGNIGSRDRLDFTVVGPAVNEVARIETLCRSLEQQVIVSSAFAQDAGPARDRLVSLGRYALKGVRRPEELFTLDPGS